MDKSSVAITPFEPRRLTDKEIPAVQINATLHGLPLFSRAYNRAIFSAEEWEYFQTEFPKVLTAIASHFEETGLSQLKAFQLDVNVHKRHPRATAISSFISELELPGLGKCAGSEDAVAVMLPVGSTH